MKNYYVMYRLYKNGEAKGIEILAKSKEEAYVQAWKAIRIKENEEAYSIWVHSVTYNNGNYKVFNTFEGKPY